jgi:predicted phosphodiesterase
MAQNGPLDRGIATRPMAFLSDVHGNLPALDSVLSDLRSRDIGAIYVAGDHLYGGSEPLDVWHRLTEVHAHCARGLSDMALASVDPASLSPQDDEERSKAEQFATTRRQLGDLVVERLRRLPEKIRIPMVDGGEIVLVHGAPADPSTEITHEMTDDEVRALVGDDPADVVVCGASHVPFHRIMDDLDVVNVGSVGAAPEGRIAHYTIITPRLEGPLVEQRWVEY